MEDTVTDMRKTVERGSGPRAFWVLLQRTRASCADAEVHYLRGDMRSPARLELAADEAGAAACGGLVEVHRGKLPGLYELTLPAAVLADGAQEVFVSVRLPQAPAVVLEIDLVAYAPADGGELGLGGFRRSVRHEHLTSIFERVMRASVAALLNPESESR